MSSEAAVEVRDLTIRYGDRLAVDGISFTAPRGAVTAILGPNGAGKTSTVEAAEGFRRPTSGTIRVLGIDPINEHEQLVKKIGVMLQAGGVANQSRVGETVELFASYYENPLPVSTVLSMVGLQEFQRSTFRSLSGGEQQRLSLALALVGQPEVAFLDEPTAGVDPIGRQKIRDVIRSLKDRGASVVLTTHDLDDVEKLADHVVILSSGQIVAAGSPQELMQADQENDFRFRAAAGLAVAEIQNLLGAKVREDQPGEYVVETQGTPAVIAKLTAWLAERDLPLADLRVGRKNLNDVFLQLTEETINESVQNQANTRRSRRRK